ncbi:MAG: CotH kinase family protein [Paludibacteraceae bacterium]|nr:CotH kinase family protein [Paludibacteraceae bacterium]
MRKIAFLISSLVIFCGCNNQKDETRLEQEKLASALPSFYISIEADMLDSIHSSQRVNTYAEATIITSTNDTIYEGDIKIKTRGNSTFFHPNYANKKSYSIKFPINIKVINCEKDNSFNLLANGLDGRQYLSNPFAFELAWSLGLHAPGYTHVHLYTNGTYKGIYQLTNKVNATPQTLSITNLSKANKKINVRNQSSYQHFPDNSEDPNAKRRGVILDENPEDISGGYIIEHCYTGKIPYLKSPSGFISELGETFRIRMPKYASYEEVEYISNFTSVP